MSIRYEVRVIVCMKDDSPTMRKTLAEFYATAPEVERVRIYEIPHNYPDDGGKLDNTLPVLAPKSSESIPVTTKTKT